MFELTAKVMIDNIATGSFKGEWGLAVYIEYEGRKILLDTGSTGDFVKNAKGLGIDLSSVEYGVLSHAHYDHSDGIANFFKVNRTADFYLREGSAEDCYGKRFIFRKYIGIKKGTLKKYKERIKLVSGDYEICPGVTLIPHKIEGLEKIGKGAGMYRKINGHFCVDNFAHEQSLVFDTQKGLVIFNSCSHGGADNIIREVTETFPNKKVHALIGGLHLFRSSESEVLSLAERIKNTGIEKVVTGHCTGKKGFEILKKELGNRIEQLYTGYTLNV